MRQAFPAYEGEITSLTSLRGVAALGVVMLHLNLQLGELAKGSAISSILGHGHLWVDFFFVLSGFIMCYVYRRHFEARVGWADYSRFICLRLIRVYPVHFATLMVFVGFEFIQLFLVSAGYLSGITVFTNQSSVFSLVANVFLIHSWGVVDVIGWNQPSWSISAEFFAYLVFPFLMVWLNAGRPAAMVLLSILSIVLLLTVQLTVGSLNTSINLGVLRGLGGFVAGMIVFYHAGHVARLGAGALNFLQSISVIGILAVMHFGVPEILVMPFFALLVFASSADRGWVARFSRLRPVYFLGLISYSLYMTHNIVTQVFHKRWATFFPKLSFVFEGPWVWLLLAVETVLIIVTAYLFYALLENPSRRYLRRKLIEN